MATRQDIITESLTWLNTPWHHRACVKGIGVDCVHLLLGIAQALHLVEPAWQAPMYSQSFHFHVEHALVQATLEALGATPVPLSTRQPGDILLFHFGLSCAHAAILLPDNRMIHAVKDQGRVLIVSLAGHWLTRLRLAYTFPGVQP
jgi:NlpC/P60 family putative phage cell wall peptidase